MVEEREPSFEESLKSNFLETFYRTGKLLQKLVEVKLISGFYYHPRSKKQKPSRIFRPLS